MNIIQKTKLRLESENKLDYEKKKRKKKAEELGLKKIIKKLCHSEGENTTPSSTTIYEYEWSHKDVDLYYRKKQGLSSRYKYKAHYKGDKVYWYSSGPIQEFKPCKWIDIITKRYGEIKDEEEKRKQERIKEKWGLDRECTSEIFQML